MILSQSLLYQIVKMICLITLVRVTGSLLWQEYVQDYTFSTSVELVSSFNLVLFLSAVRGRSFHQLPSLIRFTASIAKRAGWYVLGALPSILARKSMWWVNLPAQFAISCHAKSNHWIEIILKGVPTVAKLITKESPWPAPWIRY